MAGEVPEPARARIIARENGKQYHEDWTSVTIAIGNNQYRAVTRPVYGAPSHLTIGCSLELWRLEEHYPSAGEAFRRALLIAEAWDAIPRYAGFDQDAAFHRAYAREKARQAAAKARERSIRW